MTLFLLVSWVIFSAIGYFGKDTIYKKYKKDVVTTPYFVLVLQGIHDGIYPWSSEKPESWEEWGGIHFKKPGSVPGTELSEETPAESMTEEMPGTESVTAPEKMPGTESVTAPEETEEKLPSKPKEFTAVERGYLDDAVFIGDSRTVGLHDYGGLDKSVFYATVGLNVYDMWEEKFCEVDGEKLTLEEALKRQQFKKIYFQIGINEMGRGTIDSFMRAYEQSVAKFKELQPDAIIFVQGIMRVTKEKSEKDAIFNNKGINARNERIAALADGQEIFYIDMNDVVCDEEGNLEKSLTFDNLHLYGSKYGIWVDFLLTKGIE